MKELIGQVVVEHQGEIHQVQNGAEKLRNVVDWMNSRNEHLNQNKSHLDLIKEYNNGI